MKILAIDSVSPNCGVALSDGARIFCETQESPKDSPRNHSRILIPSADSLLAKAGIKLGDIDAFAFNAGPGGFSGARLGCATAQGFAYACGKKAVAVPGLLALAERCRREESPAHSRFAAALPAYENYVFFAAYEKIGDEWQAAVTPQICAMDKIPPLPKGEWIFCGEGFSSQSGIAEIQKTQFPDALAVLNLAESVAVRRTEFAGVKISSAMDATPLYVREKVALTIEERLTAAGGGRQNSAAEKK